MLVRNVENIVVVEEAGRIEPIGVARAADILRLRRWVIEEESHDPASSLEHAAGSAETQ